MSLEPKVSDHVRGLDSIRFVCAIWVYFGHGALPQGLELFSDYPLVNLAWRAVWRNIWCGPAAVIVFFVISGFCIHYPFAGSEKRPRLAEFYSRRFLRLMVPVVVAVGLSQPIGLQWSMFQDSILWSLLAEMIYYACYPAIRVLHLRVRSWPVLVGVAFVAAILVAATNPRAGNYPSYGPAWNWVLGLPCWLLGCQVAEITRTSSTPEVSRRSIWMWRGAVFGAAWLCSITRFHTPVGFPWTLNLFSVLAAWWVHREIAFRRQVSPLRALEWAGLWSYSLYLIHVPAGALIVQVYPALYTLSLGWVLAIAFVLLASYTFYLLVERPSHWLARRVAMQLRPKV